MFKNLIPLAAVTIAAAALAGPNHELLDPATDSPGLEVGDRAPEVELLSVDGESVELQSLIDNGPVVLTFYRGGWCPYCNMALKDWAGRFDELTSAGGMFIAVTPEKPEAARATLAKADAGYEVYVDPDGHIGKAFRVQFELDAATQKKYKEYGINLERANANGEWELPAPATFVIDADGVIRYVHAEWDYSTKARANPDEVIAVVRDLD